MSTSATLPSTTQIRPSRLMGLLVAVAIVTGITTWSVSQVTNEDDARSNPQAALGDQTARRTLSTPTSQRPASVLPPAYAVSVAALSDEQRAAIWGNVSPTRQYVDAVTALTPEHQAATSGNVGGAGAFIPAAHASGMDGAGGPLAAIGGAGAFIPFTPAES